MTWIANAPETPKMLHPKHACRSYHACESSTGPSGAIFLIFLAGNGDLSEFFAVACKAGAAEPGEPKGAKRC